MASIVVWQYDLTGLADNLYLCISNGKVRCIPLDQLPMLVDRVKFFVPSARMLWTWAAFSFAFRSSRPVTSYHSHKCIISKYQAHIAM